MLCFPAPTSYIIQKPKKPEKPGNQKKVDNIAAEAYREKYDHSEKRRSGRQECHRTPHIKYIHCTKSADRGETKLTISFKSEENKRLRRQEKIIDSLQKGGMNEDAQEIADCGTQFRVGKCLDCAISPAYPVRCRHKLCPSCQSARAERFIREHSEILRKLKFPKMLTLTFLSVPHLTPAYLKWARQCFVKLRRRKIFRGCWGGVYSFEVTYSKKNGWHVHLHCLIGSAYLAQKDVSREWEDITGACVVDIRAVKRGPTSTIWSAVREVVKYSSKTVGFADDGDLVREFLGAVKGANLAYGFGAMYHARIPEEEKCQCPFCGSTNLDWGVGGYVGKEDVRKTRKGYVYIPP